MSDQVYLTVSDNNTTLTNKLETVNLKLMALIDRDKIDITPWCIRLRPASFVSEELRGYQDNKGRIDFGDTDALNAYNKAALKVMAGLELDLPEENLVPTVCLRQAYLTVLLDGILYSGANVLEIGTGASAVIAMIARKCHGLRVTATEISQNSFAAARANIQRNKLDGITLIKSEGGIITGIISPTETFDAVICYPPTYPELDRKNYTPSTVTSGFKGTESEMIGGGKMGYDFIRRYITEALQAQITYITLLLIFEKHVTMAKTQLENADKTVKVVELEAGTRTRFVLVAS